MYEIEALVLSVMANDYTQQAHPSTTYVICALFVFPPSGVHLPKSDVCLPSAIAPPRVNPITTFLVISAHILCHIAVTQVRSRIDPTTKRSQIKYPLLLCLLLGGAYDV